MTGATLIVKQGNNFSLCKVRTDGGNMPKLVSKIDPSIHNTPELFSKQFMKSHMDQFDAFWAGSQLKLTQRNIPFELEYEMPMCNLSPEEVFNIVQEEAHQLMWDNARFDPYTCDYSDYRILYDLDTTTMYQIFPI